MQRDEGFDRVLVPMAIFGDPFFAGNNARVGHWVHIWCHCEWKQNPYNAFLLDESDEEIKRAMHLAWLVRDKVGLRLTGPYKEYRWLLPSAEKNKPWHTYFAEADGQGLVKIGRAKDVVKRVSSLQTGSSARLVVIGTLRGDLERDWHQRFSSKRVKGEWFRLDDELRAAITRGAF